MTQLSEYLKPYYLKQEVAKTISSAIEEVKKAVSIKTKKEAITRIYPSDLENIYVRDPVIFNGVNLYVKTIMSTNHEFICENKDEQEYMEWWSNLVDFPEIVTKMVQHMCIYGNAWNEIIYNESSTDIIRLDTLDPKFIDFSKTIEDRFIYDILSKEPKYYVQYIDYNTTDDELTGKKIVTQRGQRAIVLDKDIIVHTPMYTVGDNFNGIGIVEPLYDEARVKRNIEKGSGQAIYKMGFPIITASVGDPKVLPNPSADVMKKISSMMKNINELSGIAVPHYVKLDILESKRIDKYQSFLDHFIAQQITGMGTPRPFVTGSGELTNRSTLDKQMLLFERTMRMIQKRISKAIERQVFTKIAEMKDFKAVPKLSWEEISLESMGSRAERIAKYVASGVITPDENIEKLIRRLEQLPQLAPGEYERKNNKNETGNKKDEEDGYQKEDEEGDESSSEEDDSKDDTKDSTKKE